MDAAKLHEFLDLDDALIDARRKHGLLAEILQNANLKRVSGNWVRKAHVALDDLWDALEEGEDEVLRLRQARERARRRDDDADEEGRPRRPPRVMGAMNADLSRDPSTVPGAIRLVLAGHHHGLKLGELVQAISAHRPDTTSTDVNSALYPMLRRREIIREGAHKSYRYILVGSAASTTEADAK